MLSAPINDDRSSSLSFFLSSYFTCCLGNDGAGSVYNEDPESAPAAVEASGATGHQETGPILLLRYR